MKPLVLFAAGESDSDFLYATRMSVGEALYVRFAEGDDLLVVPTLELERARRQATPGCVIDRLEAGWREQPDGTAAWADAAVKVLGDHASGGVRVSPRLPAGHYVALRERGLDVELDRQLFVEERRRKSGEEASFIRAAQEAAQVACVEVIANLAAARIGDDGLLWLDDHPLTSERLMARAQGALQEIGYGAAEMIVAGPPDSALPHFRGEGPIRAHGPVIIDIFPRGASSHYHGDLTRTVVVGYVDERVARMHEAAVEALETGRSILRAGVNGRDVHHAVCRVLVERGFGTTTTGFEGNPEGPRMNHSTGHGVGLQVHEAPQLRDLDYPLLAGDVVTVEPGLYLAGLGGVRVENTGMVTEEGFDDFTTLPLSLDPADYL
ncbi:MAG: Xaa-Pro peptidase family protein [Candidatus Dormibacteraeota bacterium]|nr:Xaa-Pro peptidase family protein [Candidatus Dormibacteraeota bacterium]